MNTKKVLLICSLFIAGALTFGFITPVTGGLGIGDVAVFERTYEDLGDRLSSLLELALEGGLGDGEALAPRGLLADLESFPVPPGDAFPFPSSFGMPSMGFIMPGTP